MVKWEEKSWVWREESAVWRLEKKDEELVEWLGLQRLVIRLVWGSHVVGLVKKRMMIRDERVNKEKMEWVQLASMP